MDDNAKALTQRCEAAKEAGHKEKLKTKETNYYGQ